MREDDSGKIEFLQAMRGIACVLVMLWHASRYFAPYGTGWAGAVFAPGASMGVDLFFLISGFIMVATTRRSDGSLLYTVRFMIKRFARVWPVYALATILLLMLGMAPPIAIMTHAGLSRLAKCLLFIPMHANGSVPPAYVFPILGVGWTLNYEMYFYAVLAVSLLFGRARWMAFFGWLALTLVALPYFFAPNKGLSLSPNTDYGFQSYLGLVTNPIILVFAVGVLIGLVYQSNLRINNIFYLVLAMLVTLSLVVFQYLAHYRVDHGVANWGLSLIPMLFVFCIASKSIRINPPRALIYLGDISFSLYLCHPFVQQEFDHYNATLTGGSPWPGLPAFFITAMLSVVVAALSHRYLELGFSNIVRDILLRIARVHYREKVLVETAA